MLYQEFVKGTGCKETDHNYQVYRDLEILYMNSDKTKDEIYEYGKKLVDNSKTEKELELEARIQAEIKSHQMMIEAYKNDITLQESLYEYDRDRERKLCIKHFKDEIKRERNMIRSLKWVLE